MDRGMLEIERQAVEREFNQNRDTIEKLSNDVRMLTARQEQLKGQHQMLAKLIEKTLPPGPQEPETKPEGQ